MNYLLDTNVVSEWVRPKPDPGVVRWLSEIDENLVFVSVVSFLELRQGIDSMNAGGRRDALDAWLRDELPSRFADRILNVSVPIAEKAGKLLSSSVKRGLNLHVVDALLAASAIVAQCALVTRNVRHFEKLDLTLINPWSRP